MRKPVGRPAKYGPPTPNKNYLKYAICRKLLRDFCRDRFIFMGDLLGGDRSCEMVKARSEFCQMTGRLRIGCNTVAKVLNTSLWTVQYWRNPKMRARKANWNRANARRHKEQRLAKRNICAGNHASV